MDADKLYPTKDPLVRRDKSYTKYTERPCESCGKPTWMYAQQRNCSHSCVASHLPQGEDHPSWKGDGAGYDAAHHRVLQVRGRASSCYNRELGVRDCTATKYDWAQIHDNDPYDPLSYVSLCRSCHNRYDHPYGDKHHASKLTEAIVREIKSRPVVRGSASAWAREFGVSVPTIRRVLVHETWAWVELEGALQ